MSAPHDTPRRPLSLAAALLPLVTMLGLLATSAMVASLTAELIVVVLIAAAAVATAVAVRHGATWGDVQRAAGERVAAVLPALLILLLIGALIATWMLSGTIPFLVYWGVRLIDPRYLALTAFLATAVMSTFTGTSWGSAATIGVAMIGTATALGAPLPLVAGAVVSGAYFGDKMSPLSDTTIVAAMAAEVDLYTHIRHMLYTAIPSFVLAAIVYTVTARMGPGTVAGVPASASALLAELDRAFRLDWVTLVPIAVTVMMIARRAPAAIAIASSCVVAGIVAIIPQGFAAADVLGATVAGVRAAMVLPGGDAAAASAGFLRIVERGGLYSMAGTLVVILAAFLLAGAMEVSGALSLLVERLMRAVDSTFALIAATLAAGATMIALTSHAGVTMLVVGAMFAPAYRARGLAPQNLSRSLEDSATLTEVLMPWTVSAMFMAATLGVPTHRYAPWAVFCYGGPIFSLLIAAAYSRTGFGISRAPDRQLG